MIKFDRYKDGNHFAVTLSYDDGNIADLRLIEIFNKYGLKATFNLNSGRIGQESVVSPDDVKTKYVGHEVAVHTVNHPHLERMPISAQVCEIMDDRRNLETLTGGIVRGMAYPYGTFDADTVTAMKACGISYSRDTAGTKGLPIPDDFLHWHPTCHHTESLPIIKNFRENTLYQRWNFGGLLYIWGHSYEFDRANNWDLAEEMCKEISGLESVWYATNVEIYDYITAVRSLIFSADGKRIYNNSVTDVWVSCDGEPLRIPAGKTVTIE